MEFPTICTTNKGGFMSPQTSWSLSNNPQIPFLTPPPSPVRYAPSPANCILSQYGPLPSETLQRTRNENNLHNWIPSSVPRFPYPPPGINYNIPQGPTACLNSCIDRKILPQEFFHSTKWPHPYPVPRLPTNVINNGGWNGASRSVNSSCPQSLTPPTYPFDYKSFRPLENSANDYAPPNRPCPVTNFYGQSPLSKILPIPFERCNSNCAPDSSNNLVPGQSFSAGHHSSHSLDEANYEQRLYSVPPTHNHSRPDKHASVQISVYDLNLLLLSPPPPPPLQSPPSSSFSDQNVHTFPQQFPSSIDGSCVPNDGNMDQKPSSQTCLLEPGSCLLPQQPICPLSCRNMNELELSLVPSVPQNLHILHPPLRSILTMPGRSDQLLSQVTLFNSRPNLHFPIEPVPPVSVRSTDEQTPLQVTVFQPKSCIPSNSVRLIVPLPAVRSMDDQTISQVTLFHRNSIPTPHSLVPTLDASNTNEHPHMHFPLFDQHYLPPLPSEQISPQHHNPLSVMKEQTPQETSIAPYSGLNSVPSQSEHAPSILNMKNSESHTLAHDVSFDANSCFQRASSQEPPLEYLPSTDSADEKIPTPRGLFDHNSVSLPTSESSESIEYLPPLGSTDEETSPQRGSSQLTSTVLTIKSADGRETLEITTYDLYLLLLPPPPPPPYPPPPSPPPSPTPSTESSAEPTLPTTGIDTPEDQLPSESTSIATISEEQLESQSSFSTCPEDHLEFQTSSFEVQIPHYSPHLLPSEKPVLPLAAMDNTSEGTFSPLPPNGIHLPLELTSPMEAICSMEESTPKQKLLTLPNSYFIPPSMIPIPPEPVYMPPVMNLNQNTPSQMSLYSTRPHPTQLFPPPELSPVCDNTQKSVYVATQYANEFPPPLAMVPLTEPKLPILVVNTPDGTLFWKPFRLPPPPLGPSAIAPFNITGNCVLPPFNMNRLCTPPQFSKPVPPFNMNRLCSPPRLSKAMPPINMNKFCTPPGFSKTILVGNMPDRLAASPVPPFVSKSACSPNQSPIIPARLIHLQARVPVYYSASAEKNGTETSNTKIILGA